MWAKSHPELSPSGCADISSSSMPRALTHTAKPSQNNLVAESGLLGVHQKLHHGNHPIRRYGLLDGGHEDVNGSFRYWSIRSQGDGQFDGPNRVSLAMVFSRLLILRDPKGGEWYHLAILRLVSLVLLGEIGPCSSEKTTLLGWGRGVSRQIPTGRSTVEGTT